MKNNQFKTNLSTALGNFLKNTNYIGDMMRNGVATMSNPKWEHFEETGIRRKEALVNNSVSNGLIHMDNGNIAASVGGQFNPFANVLYASLDASKANRIYEYRLMASYPEVGDAIEEISNSFINQDERRRIIHFRYNDIEMDNEKLKKLEDEFNYFINLFNLKERGKKYCEDYLIDGELFLELIVCTAAEYTKKRGIVGALKLQTELMEAHYKDKFNDVIAAFTGKSITFEGQNNNNIIKMEHVPYQANQVLYIHSDNWDPTGEFVIPYIERARRRYIQLSYLEDAIVIYRLVRAPERLVFTVDTGNLPTAKAEAHLQRLKNNYFKSKAFDISTGDITQKFEPQSMLDSYWISKGTGNDGVTITQLQGGQNLGQLDDLNYFIKALYRALRVPTNRLESESTGSLDASTLLREEIRFAEFVISIQRKFAEAFKQAFISHLKFTGLYDEFRLKEHLMDLEFVPPSNYFYMRRLQAIQIAGDAYSKIGSIDAISKTWALKNVMGLSDNEILQQYRLRKLEAAQEFEIAQITASGPNWKSVMLMQQAGLADNAEAGGDMGGDFGGGDMGGGIGGDFSGGDMAPEGGEVGELDAAEETLDENPGGNMEEL